MRPSTPSHFRVVHWNPERRSTTVEEFMMRPTFDPDAEKVASELLADIRARGEAAILAAMARIDGVTVHPTGLRISDREYEAAEARLAPAVKGSILEAHNRVADFARRSMRPDWEAETPHGGRLGERFAPLSRVGVYVPGGTAPLASTVVMTATLAQVAGVPEIVACTPCAKDGSVRPEILFAMKVCGVTEAYRVGGIQAIGMMAYGTRRVPAVEKIVGPGNAFVTAAKRQVYGTVALDLVAGPSECAILADATAKPDWVAADLLAQAEHGSGHERAMLVTDSPALADAVAAILPERIRRMSRRATVERVVNRGGILIATAPSLADGMDLVNRFAPEHFEIMCKDAAKLMKGVRSAGAVFAGAWTPESAGDFVAGPSHVLPTGGAANMFNGLTPDDFRRRHSFVAFTRGDLAETRATIEAFAQVEGLDAHGRAASIRFEAAKK